MAHDHAPKPIRAERAGTAAAGFGGAAPVHALAAAAGMLNAAPAVAAQRKLAKRLARPIQLKAAGSGTAPIQLYQTVHGAKISNAGNLCLVGQHELFAGPTQLAQANALPGGVGFEQTNQRPPGNLTAHVANNLRRTKPVLKPNFDAPNVNFQTDAHRAVTSPSHADIIEDSAFRNQVGRPGGFNAGNFAAYKKRVKRAKGPLLPSDCGHTAAIVAGHSNQPQPNESAVMRPGSVYRLTSNHAHAEWPYHFAAVTMTDGPDHVTLENAAAKASQQHSKYVLDKGWWYDMFGPAIGQSFAEKYAGDLPNGTLRRLHPTPPPGIVSNILGGISSAAGSVAGGVSRGVSRGLSALKFW